MGIVSKKMSRRLLLLVWSSWHCLGFVFFPFEVFLFEDGISISTGHKSSNVSFTYKISSSSSVVLYRREKHHLIKSLIQSVRPHSITTTALLLVTGKSSPTTGKQVNLSHGRKLNQPPPPAGTRNPKHNFL